MVNAVSEFVKSKRMFSLGSLLLSAVLFLNAVAILHPERFLRKSERLLVVHLLISQSAGVIRLLSLSA